MGFYLRLRIYYQSDEISINIFNFFSTATTKNPGENVSLKNYPFKKVKIKKTQFTELNIKIENRFRSEFKKKRKKKKEQCPEK